MHDIATKAGIQSACSMGAACVFVYVCHSNSKTPWYFAEEGSTKDEIISCCSFSIQRIFDVYESLKPQLIYLIVPFASRSVGRL